MPPRTSGEGLCARARELPVGALGVEPRSNPQPPHRKPKLASPRTERLRSAFLAERSIRELRTGNEENSTNREPHRPRIYFLDGSPAVSVSPPLARRWYTVPPLGKRLNHSSARFTGGSWRRPSLIAGHLVLPWAYEDRGPAGGKLGWRLEVGNARDAHLRWPRRRHGAAWLIHWQTP